MSFEWLIGWRQVRARRRNHFISFISLLSTIAIALGVASLIVVMAVIDGLQSELRSRILGVAAHAEVGAREGTGTAYEGLSDWQAVREQMLAEPGVQGAAGFVRGQALLALGDAVRGVEVRGVLPDTEAAVSDIATHVLGGRFDDLREGEFGIVIGADTARSLRALPGDRITLISPQGVVTPAGILPRVKVFRLVGIFEVGMPEYDAGLAYVHLADAQRLYRMGESVSGVRLRLSDLGKAPALARRIERDSPRLAVLDWTRTHAAFFRALQIERMATFIMLSLIVAVAAFNVVSMLVMAVNEKRAEIAILRTMGAMPRSIQAIFMIQGMILGVAGTLSGAVLGCTIALQMGSLVRWVEQTLDGQSLPAEVYYLTLLPSRLEWQGVLGIVILSLVLSLAATLYPSWRAARVRPAEALRHA
jgi:lipoprotein-releasing system permease protein